MDVSLSNRQRPTSPHSRSPPAAAVKPKEKSSLTSGSHASAIPEGALAGFASTGFLLRENVLSLEAPDDVLVVPTRKKRSRKTGGASGTIEDESSAKSSKKSAKGGSTGDRKKPTQRKRKGDVPVPPESTIPIVRDGGHNTEKSVTASIVDALGEGPGAQHLTVEKPKRKSRAKKKSIGNTNLSEVEDGEQSSKGIDVEKRSTGKTSKHFASEGPGIVETPSALKVDEDLNLERAVKRRNDWTPVKDTSKSAAAGDDGMAKSPLVAATVSFSDTLLGFQYSGSTGIRKSTDESRNMMREGVTKRRRLEFIKTTSAENTGSAMPATIKSRPKSPKKKPITITDIATARYRQLENHPSLEIPAPLLAPHFESAKPIGLASTERGADGTTASRPDAHSLEKPLIAKRSTRTTKAKANEPKKKKVAIVAPKLLSPESAMRRANNQSILFGTSSQLAQPESPTFIRVLQQSMLDSGPSWKEAAEPEVMSRSLALAKGSGGLWAAAARDHEGELMAVEVINTKHIASSHSGDCAIGFSVNVPLVIEDKTPLSDRTRRPSEPGGTTTSNGGSTGAINHGSPQTQAMLRRTTTSDFMHIDDIESDHDSLPPLGDQHRVSHLDGISDPFVLPIRSSSPICDGLAGSVSPSRPIATSRHILKSLPINLGSSPVGSPMMTSPTKGSLMESSPMKGSPVKRKSTKGGSTKESSMESSSTKDGLSRIASKYPQPSVNDLGFASHITSRTANPTQNMTTAVRTDANVPAVEKSKKSKGRPRKARKADGQTRDGPAMTGSRGKRPGKMHEEGAAEENRDGHGRSAPSKKGQEKEWTHIDEIEDSEADFTPSPPRRGNITSAAATLQLSPSKGKYRSEASFPNWAAKSASVFMAITQCIRSESPASDSAHPSWHEKILLYDPIGIENLASWLGTQGLTVTGKNGVEHELESWMVRKWCEANSICCYSKHTASRLGKPS